MLLYTPTTQLGFRRASRNFLELTKFKLSVLNSLVTVSAFALYPSAVSGVPLFLSSLALSMSTQALNQCIEVPYDKLMVRTSQRPLVVGAFSRWFAIACGMGLGALGMYGLSLYNLKTMLIGGVIWAGYLLVYTPMKRT